MVFWGRFVLVTQDASSLAFKLRTPAATRALIGALLGGVILGLTFGAVCVAGAQTSSDLSRAQALGQAAQAGYAAAHAAPAAASHLAVPPPLAVRVIAPAPRRLAVRAGDLNCLAAAVYYEARGETLAGRAAVAQVVLNRVGRGAFPDSVCAVVYQGRQQGECQFSFVCNGAMNGRREAEAWLDARAVASRALGGYVMAAVGNATFFHAAHGPAPRDGVRLGGHVFYAAYTRHAAAQARPIRMASAEPAARPRARYSVAGTDSTSTADAPSKPVELASATLKTAS